MLTGGGMLAIALMSASASTWILGGVLFIAGAGIGLFVQVSVLAGQNAVDYSQLGVATGALNFFKTIGGAFGAAIFGAILAAEISSSSAAIHDAHTFQVLFFWSVPFMVVALILGVVMKEKPLSQEMVEVAAGSVEVGEF